MNLLGTVTLAFPHHTASSRSFFVLPTLLLAGLLTASVFASAETKPAKVAKKRPPTRVAVEKMITQAGKTQPDWWDSVELDYPDTLDLSGKNKASGWAPRVNLGAYYWSIVNPNPKRWKPGVKLLHKVMAVRKDDPQRLTESMRTLGRAYQRLLNDWARAAYWYRKAQARSKKKQLWTIVALAECYRKLGSERMAITLLRKHRLHKTAYSSAIKLWSSLGQNALAIRLGKALASRRKDVGNLALGNAYRAAGQYDKAIEAYNRVLNVKESRRSKKSRKAAKLYIELIESTRDLDLSQVPDGTYTGVSEGFKGQLTIEIVMAGGIISNVKVTKHKEDQPYRSIQDIPQQIVETQNLAHVDAITSATVTSNAIISATARALKSAMK